MPFSAEAIQEFDRALLDAPGHEGWSEPHSRYNQAVIKEVKSYLKAKNIDPSKMTAKQARGLINFIKSSKNSDIADFLKAIKKAGGTPPKGGTGRSGRASNACLATLGATAITVAGATYFYDEYVSLGWSQGIPKAKKVGLGRALQLLGQADMLPRAQNFSYVTKGGDTYYVSYVKRDGVWYFTVTEDVEHWFYTELVVLIPVGEVPTNYEPIFHEPGEPVFRGGGSILGGRPGPPRPDD